METLIFTSPQSTPVTVTLPVETDKSSAPADIFCKTVILGKSAPDAGGTDLYIGGGDVHPHTGAFSPLLQLFAGGWIYTLP